MSKRHKPEEVVAKLRQVDVLTSQGQTVAGGGCAGWVVNAKRVERIWRREGLKVPRKQPKKGRLWFNDGSCVRLRPEHPNHVWSYDFVEDRTGERMFRHIEAEARSRGELASAVAPRRPECQFIGSLVRTHD